MLSPSHARRFSLKEVLMLLAPCLLLAVFALAMRNRGGNTIDLNKHFALTMEKYEFEPVTPREVSQGYSAKLKVILNHVGPTPAWWRKVSRGVGTNNSGRLIYSNADQSRPVLMPPNFKYEFDIMLWHPQYDVATDRYIAKFLIPLARVPAQKANVVLKSKVVIGDQNGKKQCAPLPLIIVLRKAGEPIKIPRVSTNPLLVVKKIEIVELGPVDRQPDGYDTELRILLRYTGAIDGEEDPIKSMPIGSGEIVDADGQRPSLSSMEYGGQFSGLPDLPYTRTMSMRTSLATIPRSAGALFFIADYSLKDEWPLHVRIPIRNAKGQRLLTQKRGAWSRLQLLSALVAPANSINLEEGCDTTVSIALRYSGVLPTGGIEKMRWTTSWSEHLIDEKGKKYWTFNYLADGVNGVGGMFFEYQSSKGNTYTTQYSFPLNQIPSSAGRVWLKAEIAVGNNAFLPVSVLVRDTPLNR